MVEALELLGLELARTVYSDSLKLFTCEDPHFVFILFIDFTFIRSLLRNNTPLMAIKGEESLGSSCVHDCPSTMLVVVDFCNVALLEDQGLEELTLVLSGKVLDVYRSDPFVVGFYPPHVSWVGPQPFTAPLDLAIQ
jgi:hypothetical protein